jgi:hypothetical protein
MAGAGTPGREGTPMHTVVPDVDGVLPADGQPSSLIDQIVRDGARQMLAAALQAEVAAYIGQFAGLRDGNGRRMVVRNGAEAVQLGDPAAVGAQDPAGQRGAAAAVPARPVVRGLRARARAVPRLACRAVGVDGDQAGAMREGVHCTRSVTA